MTTTSFRTTFACPPGKPLSAPQVRAIIDPAFNRVGNDTDDKRIDELWEAKRAARPNARLFNALKFRLAASHVLVADDAAASPIALQLSLGLTDYKSHTGTNVAPFSDHDEDGQKINNYEDANMANALGVEACVITEDGNFVLFKRSQTVADFAGFYCCPGGHSEPTRVFQRVVQLNNQKNGPFSTLNDVDPAASILMRADLSAAEFNKMFTQWICELHEKTTGQGEQQQQQQLLSQLIVEEIFASICDEVHDEVGVPKELIECRGVIGMMLATGADQRGKPDALFSIRLKCTLAEVKKYFAVRKGEDAFEAEDDSLIGVPVTEAGIKEAFAELNITPASKAALELALSRC